MVVLDVGDGGGGGDNRRRMVSTARGQGKIY